MTVPQEVTLARHAVDLDDDGHELILYSVTAETDTTKRLAPNGTGGVAWGTGGGTGGASDVMVPTYLGPTETFTVPVDRQITFAMTIDNEGILVVDGFLVLVNGDEDEILDLPTAETDTSLVLSPDGAGGVVWVAPGVGSMGPAGPAGPPGVDGNEGPAGPPGLAAVASAGGGATGLDVPPASAHAKDDEFTGTSLDAKWTAGSVSIVTTVGNGWLNITAGVASKYAYMIRQVSPTGDFSIMGKIANAIGSTLSDTRPGLFIARTTGTKALVCGLGLSGGPSKAMWIEHSNYSEAADWGAYNGSWSSNQGGTYAGGPVWFRMRWVSASSTIFTDYSVDGVVWYAFSSRAGWSQPDRIGIVIENNTGNTNILESISVDWFRVTEP